MSPLTLFLWHDSVAYSSIFLSIYINFQISLSIFTKKPARILNGIALCLNLFISSLNFAVFSNFHYTNNVVHLLNIFLSILFFLMLLCVYLISFSDCSLQVYENTVDFCILILYLANFLNSYIQFSSVQFSRSVISDSLRPHELQHARPSCPLPFPGVQSNSRPSSQ